MSRPPSLGFCLTGFGSFGKLGNLKEGFLSVGNSGFPLDLVVKVFGPIVEKEGALDTPEMCEAVLTSEA